MLVASSSDWFNFLTFPLSGSSILRLSVAKVSIVLRFLCQNFYIQAFEPLEYPKLRTWSWLSRARRTYLSVWQHPR